MAFLPKAIVEKNIKERSRTDRLGNQRTDYEAYLGIDPFTQKPVRISRGDKKELEQDIADFYRRHKFGGDAAARLTAIQAIDAKNAYDVLASANLKVSLFDVASAYVGGLNAKDSPTIKKSVAEAFDEYYRGKVDGADKTKTFSTVGKWAQKNGGKQLVAVTAKDVATYLQTNYGTHKPKTYNSHLLYLKTFFNWCCKEERKYLPKNPIKSLELKPDPWEEPEYMKPDEVRRLFALLESAKGEKPELLAYAVASFFCGCRAVEIQRMAADPDAAKINIEEETVRIAKAKGYQQGKRPRAFHIEPTAVAWMKSFDFLGALKKVTNDTLLEIFDLARRNGIHVFQNCGRHTFITYHVAAYGDPAKTTAMVGTSDKMRADNYCGLATKKDGEAYFKILPAVA